MINCRICRHEVGTFLDLGNHPLPEGLRIEAEMKRPVERYPVQLGACTSCYHVQLGKTVSPDTIYKHNYYYDYSFNPQGHWHKLADNLTRQLKFGVESTVVDLGCNSGVLLSKFIKLGIKTAVGVDPNPAAARIARRRGLPVYAEYFIPSLAQKIRRRYGPADLITCTNTFDHVDDLDSFVEAVCQLLRPKGVFVIEVPYLGSLLRLKHLPYLQQIDYFALTPIIRLLSNHHLTVTDAQLIPIHGGSLRVTAAKTGRQSEGVDKMFKSETGLYKKFFAILAKYSRELTAYLTDFEKMVSRLGKTHSIAAVGASAKGMALLNYCHLDSRAIGFISEASPLKIGRFTPSGIPIVTDGYLLAHQPDYALILTWNFAKKIINNLRSYSGKFILPLPRPVILK